MTIDSTPAAQPRWRRGWGSVGGGGSPGVPAGGLVSRGPACHFFPQSAAKLRRRDRKSQQFGPFPQVTLRGQGLRNFDRTPRNYEGFECHSPPVGKSGAHRGKVGVQEGRLGGWDGGGVGGAVGQVAGRAARWEERSPGSQQRRPGRRAGGQVGGAVARVAAASASSQGGRPGGRSGRPGRSSVGQVAGRAVRWEERSPGSPERRPGRRSVRSGRSASGQVAGASPRSPERSLRSERGRPGERSVRSGRTADGQVGGALAPASGACGGEPQCFPSEIPPWIGAMLWHRDPSGSGQHEATRSSSDTDLGLQTRTLPASLLTRERLGDRSLTGRGAKARADPWRYL